MARASSPARILLIGLALGWSVDLLFYGKALGMSFPLFVLLVLAALFGLGRLADVSPKRRSLWLVVVLVFLAGMVFVRANLFITVLNVGASLVLLGFVAHFYAAGAMERLGLLDYALVPLISVAQAVVRPVPLIAASVDFGQARERSSRNLFPVARGLLLAMPVLIVFTGLLASADVVFASYVRDIVNLQILADLPELFWRSVIILGAAWFLAGGLAYALSRANASDKESILRQVSRSITETVSLGFVEAVTLLSSVDLLFLVFVWIQFAYLFGGRTNITVDGYTYAEYARRGFFELVAVSVLALGLILGLHWLTRRETDRQEQAFNAVSSVMIGLLLVMLASAFQRLRLYELAFGYTELRFYSHVFMVWLVIVFVWFLVTLWGRPSRFAIGAFVAALGFLITLNAITPDAFIARQNLARYQATGKLDTEYLTRLSDDAVPVLVSAADDLEADERQQLTDHLQQRLNRLERQQRRQSWPSFHLAHWRAYKALRAME